MRGVLPILSMDHTTADHAPAPDGRIRATENEIGILRALSRFGWLTGRSLAAMFWSTRANVPTQAPSFQPATVTSSGLRMAQRTVRRLLQKGEVLRASAPGGRVIYALAEAGARRLRQAGVPASTGKDLIRGFSAAHFQHRDLANQVAIRGFIDGFRISTEREIACDKWLGGAAGIGGKKPDVLLRSGKKIFWVEVEKSRRNSKDFAKLVGWLEQVRRDASRPDGPRMFSSAGCLAKIVFICTSAFRVKLTRELQELGWTPGDVEKLLSYETTQLYSYEIGLMM